MMITGLLAGDVWLPSSLNKNRELLEKYLADIVDAKELDIFVCNLEAPIASGVPRPNRRTIIRSDPSLLDVLKIAKKNILVLANNHLNDFGPQGVIDTLVECRKQGFAIVGAGRNLREASRPIIIEIEGRRIAIMAFAETARYVGAIIAGPNSPGVAPLEVELVVETIESIKKEVDDIWVFLHWGKEFIRFPSVAQRKQVRFLIEKGANLVVGHHPHVVVGREKLGKANVYYSLGNFIFPNVPLQDGSTFRWGRTSRASICLEMHFTGELWQIGVCQVFLDERGIPVPSKDIRLVRAFKMISKILQFPHYDDIYLFLEIAEKTRINFERIFHIRQLIKDLQWFLKKRKVQG